jgi:DNA-binding beta-propeller fold protein YncE
MRRWLGVLVVCAVAAVVSGFASLAGAFGPRTTLPTGGKVYWGANSNGVISEAELDGSGGSTVSVGSASVDQPVGTALDPATNKVYWVNFGSKSISVANLDGTGQGQTLYSTAAQDVDSPVSLAIDPATNKIYWDNILSDTIVEANLDGSGGIEVMNTTGVTITDPQGIAIDPADNKLFFADFTEIAETSLDDTGNAHTLNLTGATANQVVGIAINPATDKIYWANAGVSKISEANLDGSGGGADLDITGATAPSEASGVAIDPAHNKIYWASKGNDHISYANLDDTGDGGDLTITGATAGAPEFPALLEAPAGTSEPPLTGGTAAGSTLTCGQGSWAPDLIGGFLYQAPQSFAYSWTRNGTPVSGATQSSLHATTGGTYSCTVTATNDAGSQARTSGAITVSNPPPPPPRPTCKLKPKSKTEKVTATSRGLHLIANCTQAARGKLTGKVTAGLSNGKHKTLKLTAVTKPIPAGKSVTLTIKLSKAALKALKHGVKEAGSFTLSATNANGSANATAKIKRVKLST